MEVFTSTLSLKNGLVILYSDIHCAFLGMIYKTFSRRYLPLDKRDRLGITCLERTKLALIERQFSGLLKLKQDLLQSGTLSRVMKRRIYRAMLDLGEKYLEVLKVEPMPVLMPRVNPTRRTIASFEALNYNFSEVFRFHSPQELQSLINHFRIPSIIRVEGYVFTNQEVLLISLIRLSYPMRWSQVEMHFPGRHRWDLKAAFYWFLDFMTVNWGYLLTNNREYWLEKLPQSAEAIRLKLESLPNENYRQFFPPADRPDS